MPAGAARPALDIDYLEPSAELSEKDTVGEG